MTHESEFSNTDGRKAAEEKRQAQARVIANTYARVFSSEDGKAVLKDLQTKFGHDRDRFTRANNFSTTGGAIIDGQCQVLREVEQAIKAGGGVI
jgi:hypothetical protein